MERTLRQHQIVKEACRIITSHGIESLTVRGLAKDLNITDGALYRHFKSKNEILSLLIDDIESSLLSAIRASAVHDNDPLEKLEKAFLSHFSYSEQMKALGFIVINEALSIKDKKLQKKVFGILNKYLKTIKGILIEGQASGRFSKSMNPDAASVLFFGAVQSMVTLWGISGYRISLRKSRLQETFNIYKGGILSVKT